ncbi:MAG: helix-turn-helix domain-containing protein, partial [Pyrinomonadaceae bacterium]|nr:helix-turn-helix domain-containing protein [Pyrinomonadaceae bacterium]
GEPETFGERIRAARELEGISKPQLAQRLGISTSTIHAWENDTVSRPTARVVNIFDDYLNEV